MCILRSRHFHHCEGEEESNKLHCRQGCLICVTSPSMKCFGAWDKQWKRILFLLHKLLHLLKCIWSIIWPVAFFFFVFPTNGLSAGDYVQDDFTNVAFWFAQYSITPPRAKVNTCHIPVCLLGWAVQAKWCTALTRVCTQMGVLFMYAPYV